MTEARQCPKLWLHQMWNLSWKTSGIGRRMLWRKGLLTLCRACCKKKVGGSGQEGGEESSWGHATVTVISLRVTTLETERVGDFWPPPHLPHCTLYKFHTKKINSILSELLRTYYYRMLELLFCNKNLDGWPAKFGSWFGTAVKLSPGPPQVSHPAEPKCPISRHHFWRKVFILLKTTYNWVE